jgi:hypothetical protein
MSYHDLSECTLTDDERIAEAGRILKILNEETLGTFTPSEFNFITRMNDATSVSVKQLFYLRDIKDKYI